MKKHGRRLILYNVSKGKIGTPHDAAQKLAGGEDKIQPP